MNNKTLLAFFTGLTMGGTLALLLAPLKGSDLRSILMEEDPNETGGIHNFSISELTSKGSASLEEIKKQLQD